jgi:hypothetical protein
MHSDTAILARIQSETSHRLDVLARRVAEGRDVMAASEFCRWLSFSGILRLLERYPNQVSSHNPLKVDGAFLRWKCEDLQATVNERLRTGNENPSFEKNEFQSMHEKIDRMAGYLSRLSVAPAVSVAPAAASEKEEISGGLDAQAPGECVPDGGRSARLVTNADMEQDSRRHAPVMN